MSKHPLYNQTGLQKNNQFHVLYALVDKQLELQQLKDENCSETIEKIKQKATDCKKKVRLFKNGELTSLVLQFLKESSAPLSTKELADLITEYKQFKNRDIRSNVKDTIKVLSKRNLLENEYDYDKSVLCYKIKTLNGD